MNTHTCKAGTGAAPALGTTVQAPSFSWPAFKPKTMLPMADNAWKQCRGTAVEGNLYSIAMYAIY